MENRNGKVEDVYWFWKVINSFNITKGFCWSVVQSFWLLFTSRNQYAHQKANDENYCEDITNIRNRCQPATKIRWTYKFQKLYLCYVGWNQWLTRIHGDTTKNHWYDSWFFPMFSVRPDVLSLKYWTWASAFYPHLNSVTIWNIQSCSTYTCGDFWQRPPH